MKVVCVSTAKVEFHYETYGKVKTNSSRTGYRGGNTNPDNKVGVLSMYFFNFPICICMKVV